MTPSRRLVLRQALGIVVAMVLAVTAAPGVNKGAEATPARSVSQTTTESMTEEHGFRLVSQTMWHGPGHQLVVEFEPDTAAGPDDDDDAITPDVRLELYAPVQDRSDLRRLAAGDDPGATLRLAPVVPMASLPADGGVVTAELAIDDDLVPGVYPWTLRVGDGTPVLSFAVVLDTTIVPPPEPEPDPDDPGDPEPGETAEGSEVTPLLVAPVLAMPQELRTDGSGAVPTSDTVATVDLLISLLTDLADITLDVVLAPAVFDHLDTPRRDLLVDILTDNRTLGGTYVPVSPVSWVADGLADQLVSQLDAGRTVATRLFGDAVDTSTLVTDAAVDAGSLGVFERAGVDGLALDDHQLVAHDVDQFGETLARPFSVASRDGSPIAAVGLDGALARPLTDRDPLLSAHQVAAELALVYLQDPDAARGVAFRVDLDHDDHFRALVAAVRSSPVLSLAGLRTLFDDIEPAGRFGEPVASGPHDVLVRPLVPTTRLDLSDYAAALENTSAAVDSYAELLVGPSPRIDTLRRRLLLSGATYLGDESRQALLANVGLEVERGLAGVTIPLPSRFTFTSRGGTIPLQIVNELGEPLTVSLELISTGAQLSFPGGAVVPLTLEPGVNRVDVAVRTRTSGDSPLTLRVTTPDGRLLMTEGRVTIRSTALSGVGIAIAIAALAVLVVWWLRHHRTRAQDRHRETADEASAP